MITTYEYQLPFKTVLKTAVHEYSERHGFIVHYQNAKHESITEIAPLPGFSKESSDEAAKTLKDHQQRIESFLDREFEKDELNDFINELTPLPSVRFGLSWLGLQLKSLRLQSHPYEILKCAPSETVQINDIISNQEPEKIKSEILNSIQNGFTTIKIKTPEPTLELAEILAEFKINHRNIVFRLDANQSWSDEMINDFNIRFENNSIEYVEEPSPLPEFETDLNKIKGLIKSPIALDESIEGFIHLDHLYQYDPDTYLIIKPMLFGTIFDLVETLSADRSRSRRVVVTSLLESAVARYALVLIASMIGDPTIAHGLNTGKLFAKDLLPDLRIRNGVISIDESALFPIRFNQIDQSLLTQL
ncbi:MAG: enolase C-terminal domain-like protein [Balneolaceae bacterium]